MRWSEVRAAFAAIDDEFARLRRLPKVDDASAEWKAANAAANKLGEETRRRYRASARGTIKISYWEHRNDVAIYLTVRDESRLQESSARIDRATGEVEIGIVVVHRHEIDKIHTVRSLVNRWIAGELDELPPSDTNGTHPWTEPGYEPEPRR